MTATNKVFVMCAAVDEGDDAGFEGEHRYDEDEGICVCGIGWTSCDFCDFEGTNHQ